MSIGNDATGETAIAEQRNPDPRKIPPGQPTPAVIPFPIDPSTLTGASDATASNEQGA